MANTDEVVKIYDLSTIGYDQIMDELTAVNVAFENIRKTKLQLQAQAFSIENTAELDAIKQKLNDLVIVEGNLRIQKLQLTNEAKAAQVVRQQEINDLKNQKTSVTAAADSYTALYKTYKELYALVKDASLSGSQDITFQGNTLGYDEAIAKLKELATQEQAFRRQFQGDGILIGEYTSGIVNAFKKLGLDDLIGGQVTRAGERVNELKSDFDLLREKIQSTSQSSAADMQKLQQAIDANRQEAKELSESLGVNISGQIVDAKQKVQELDQQFEALNSELLQTREVSSSTLNNLESQLIANVKETTQLTSQIATLQSEMRGTGDIGNQITTSLGEGFKNVKSQISQVVIGYLGFQAAFQGIIGGIDITKELADQTTNLEIELGKTSGGLKTFIDQLAQLNTRTKLTVLEDIANIAARAGVGEQQLLGVTAAIDKIKIAFGKDFGDVEQGTEALVKIVNIFEGTQNVTGDNLLRVGNAVRTLANESVASVPFINDFTKRMAGLKGISDISLPSVLGLASGFEQFGQSAEVSSTALVRIIPKLASDTEKYAAIANVTADSFKKLLNENPAEALIKVSQGLVAGKGSIEEISQAFEDSSLGKGRIASVLGVLGKNADTFRASIASAGEAFNNTTNITEAFNAKNENLASTLDKISKSFADAANSSAFRFSLTAIAAVITLLIANLPIIIALGGLLAISWAAQNTQLLLLNLQLIGYNVALGASYIALGALTIAQVLYNGVLFVGSTALGLLNRALSLFNITAKASSGPLGILLTIIGLLATAYAAFGRGLDDIKNKLSDFAERQRINVQVLQIANAAIADQKTQLDGYITIVKNAAYSIDVKSEALKKLIALNPAFRDAVQGQTIDLQKLDAAYQQVITSIRAKAEVDAASGLATDKQKAALQITSLRQTVENENSIGSGNTRTISGLSDDEIKILFEGIDQQNNSLREAGEGRIQFLEKDFSAIIDNLKSKESDAVNKYTQYLTVLGQKQADLLKLQNDNNKQQGAVAKGATASFEIDIVALQTKLDALNDQIKSFQGAQKDLNALIAQRDTTQDQLNDALGKKQSGAAYGGAKLTGDQRDAFKDLDAQRDEAIAEEDLRHQQLQEQAQTEGESISNEKQYLDNLRTINEDYYNAKIALLNGANARERQLKAQFMLQDLKDEQSTNEKKFNIDEKALQQLLDLTTKQAQEGAKKVQVNPNATPTAKVQAELDANKTILAAQEQTYQLLLDLAKKYNLDLSKLGSSNLIDLLKKLQDAIHASDAAITNDTREIVLARAKDLQQAADNISAAFNVVIDKNKADINANNSLSQVDRDNDLRLEENERKIGLLKIQQGLYKNLADEFKSDYDKGLITLAEYEAVLKKLQEITQEIKDSNLKPVKNNDQQQDESTDDGATIHRASDLKPSGNNKGAYDPGNIKDVKNIQGAADLGLDELFGLDKVSPEAQGVAAVVSNAYSTMQSAMTSYFSAEEAAIKNSLKLKDEQIDAETQQLEARSESAAQTASIERKANDEKQKAAADALEKTKKAKKAEAAIAFATELANIWSSTAQYGILGPEVGAILTALALVRYESEVSTINAQTAAKGLTVSSEGGHDTTTTRGGKVKGRSHARGGNPIYFKGRVIEDEVNELNIIRTKNAPANKTYTITGNHTQIASALNEIGGGVKFAGGASIMNNYSYDGSLINNYESEKITRFDFGGSLGEALQPPTFSTRPASNVTNYYGVQRKDLDEIVSEFRGIADAQSQRIDNIQVQQVTSTVTKAQAKKVKQSKIASL